MLLLQQFDNLRYLNLVFLSVVDFQAVQNYTALSVTQKSSATGDTKQSSL